MAELLLAGVLVAFLRERLGVTPEALIPVVTMAWLPLYLASCWWRPYRRCPWPWCRKRRQVVSDKRGNYRRRRPCLVCGNEDWRRIGARVIGRG